MGDQWANVAFAFSSNTGDGSTYNQTLDNCFYCDATLSLDTFHLLRFQQGDGYSIWSLYFSGDESVGTHTLLQGNDVTYFFHSESDSDVPADFQGPYFGFQTQSGTLTLTSAEYFSGGTVAGSFDVTMTGGNADPPATLHMVGTFSAIFP
jgi:hypothetical protein